MPKKVQITLTGNESKRLIAKAAIRLPEVRQCLFEGHRLFLAGGTTVSAMSEELGYGPLRISGRIDEGGTRSALKRVAAPHNLLVRSGRAIDIDDNIREVVAEMDSSDLIVVGANAIDHQGRAALAFASAGGGSRGYALHDAYIRGIPMVVLSGLNKLIPDLGIAMAHSGLSGLEHSMGAAIGLYHIFGPIITETKAFELLFDVQAVTIAGGGIAGGEGSRTFVLLGEEENIRQAWKATIALKGSSLSGVEESLRVCRGGCENCARHVGCMYKEAAQRTVRQGV